MRAAAAHDRFEERLRSSVTALAEVLARPGFGEGPRTLGAELELFLVDGHGQALPINQQVLAKARKGVYRESAFRATAPAMREKYFTREADGSSRIRDEIRNRVSFGRLNLYDEARVSLLGHLDTAPPEAVVVAAGTSCRH